jgi:RNA polymerase sigma-70 factor (ECF subfamily)
MGWRSNDPATPADRNVVALRVVRPLLLEALRANDPAAATRLFDLHVDTIEKAVHGVLGPDVEAEDVVQEAFLIALRDIARFRGEQRQLGAWIRGIAVRLALKKIRWRKARRWLSRSGSDALDGLPATADPQAAVALRRAYAVLDTLPASERAAFGLRMIEGLSLPEVAAALGVSLATAKRRLVRARQRFHGRAAKDPLLRDWMREVER